VIIMTARHTLQAVVIGAALLATLIVPAIAGPSTSAPAEKSHSVQVGAFPTLQEAQARQAQLQSLGYDPVFILPDSGDGWNRVCFGRFDIYMDARLQRDLIRESGTEPDAFVQEIAADPSASVSDNAAPFQSMFGIESSLLSAAGGEIAPKRNAGRDRSEALALYNSTNSNADPQRADAMLDLAFDHAARGEHEAALELRRAVATGRVATDPTTRLQACWETACSLYSTQDRREEAYRAFWELRSMDRGAPARAQSAVFQVALLMELARSGKGSMQDCRRAAERWLSEIPQSGQPFLQNRATLELMHLETFFHEGDHDTVVKLGAEFVERHTGLGADTPWREVGMAMYLLAQINLIRHDNEEAEHWFNRMLAEVPSDAEHFARYHPHAQALAGLSVLLAREERYAESMDIMRALVREFPDEEVTATIRAGYPHLAVQGG
jgi:tetratricopeptide (TPR) repeat protein